MPRILTVIGATGPQGLSVINNVLSDPQLSTTFTIRAITRDTSSAKAQSLSCSNVQVVEAEPSSPTSLASAFANTDTAFIITNAALPPPPDADPEQLEFAQGKTLIDAAIAAHVRYIIFSALPSVAALTNGKYTGVFHFEAKARLQSYLRSRSADVQSAFISPGAFMQNFATLPFFAPQPVGDGTYRLVLPAAPEARLGLIDAQRDIGKYVAAILASPRELEGRTLAVASEQLSLEEVVGALSRSSGKEVRYVQVPIEAYREQLPFAREALAPVLAYWGEVGGYWGPESQRLVVEGLELARGRPRTFKEFLDEHPLVLE